MLSIIALSLVATLIFPIAPISPITPAGDFISPEYCTEHDNSATAEGFCNTEATAEAEENVIVIDDWAFYPDGRSCPVDAGLPDYGEIREPIVRDKDGNLRTPTRLIPDVNGRVYVISTKAVLNGAAELVTTRDGFQALFYVDNPSLGAAICIDNDGNVHYGTGTAEIVVLSH